MLSRVAENLYWTCRYIERAENVARLLDDSFHLELDSSSLAASGDRSGPVESVLTILACQDSFLRRHKAGGRQAVLRFLTFDRDHHHSIVAMLGRARENARGTQETLSAEAWGQINRLYLYLNGPRARRRFRSSPSRFFEGVKRSCILFSGIVESTLPRTEVYHFLQLGRYLERVNQISRILEVKLHGLREDGPIAESTLRIVYWSSLLQSCSAYEAYIRKYHDKIDPEGVVRYLVLDPDFPRSMRFGVARCCESLKEISGEDDDEICTTEGARLLGRLDSELRFLDTDEIFHQGLDHFLKHIQQTCNRVGDEIHQAYFLT